MMAKRAGRTDDLSDRVWDGARGLEWTVPTLRPITHSSMNDQHQTNPLAVKNNRLLIKLAITGVLMFCFCYAMVPFYRLICKKTGINGQGNFRVAQLAPGLKVDQERLIDVLFSTTIHGQLPFKFKPLIRHLQLHPGERKLIYFYAENTTGHDITVQAIPSITPNEAANYLKKTECFCFTQQYFFNHEKADMPVYFYIDPDLPKNIQDVTLSYTLFDATPFIKKDQKHFRKGRIQL